MENSEWKSLRSSFSTVIVKLKNMIYFLHRLVRLFSNMLSAIVGAEACSGGCISPKMTTCTSVSVTFRAQERSILPHHVAQVQEQNYSKLLLGENAEWSENVCRKEGQGRGGGTFGNKWKGEEKVKLLPLRWWTLNALCRVDISPPPFVWLNTAPFYPHTKPVSTHKWQAFQWRGRHVNGLWLASSLRRGSSSIAPPTLPDSWQDFVMEICDGQNSTKTRFPAFICRNNFMVRMKTESAWLFRNSHACACMIFMTGAIPGPLGYSSDWLRTQWIVLQQAG